MLPVPDKVENEFGTSSRLPKMPFTKVRQLSDYICFELSTRTNFRSTEPPLAFPKKYNFFTYAKRNILATRNV